MNVCSQGDPIVQQAGAGWISSPRRFGVCVALCSMLCVCFAHGAAPFDFEGLRSRARDIAARPHVPRRGEVPEWLRRLNYDQLRQIEFDGRESLWLPEKLPFQVQFLHPGFLYDKTVLVSEVRGAQAEVLPFRRAYYQYGSLPVGDMPAGMGFAGIRLMYPLGGARQPIREAGSFLGASYFRFLCAGAGYGLSARGLALDTAEAVSEEFPAFTEFWLERPAPGATSLKVFALLESESVAGAYRFVISPGETTVMVVSAVIFQRKESRAFGLAPLTSMFWRGENSNGPTDDYRPEVHDSDGLVIQNGRGEWIWRPLANPRQVRVSAFGDEDPRRFGLLQRDRNFENYQDLEARYHARPSAWVEPVGKWGKGAVQLVELPTKDEFNDNIVVYWTPERLPPIGEPIEVEYRLHWCLDQIRPPAGYVRSTRLGRSAFYEPGLERFVVDFDGSQLQGIPADARVEHVLSVGAGGSLNHSAIQKNAINGTWRVAFTVKPDGSGRPVELRCFLRRGADALTETWSYLWQP